MLVLVLVFAGIFVAAVAGVVVFAERAVNATTPQGIVPRLLKTGAPHDVRLRGSGQTWNPGRSWAPRNWIYGAGEGTYWMDDDGFVHLDWRPAKGSVEHWVGPVPSVADPRDPSRARSRRAARTVLAVYAACTAAGFALGYAFSSGAPGHRATLATFAAALSYFVAYFVMLIGLVIVKRRRHGRTSAPTDG